MLSYPDRHRFKQIRARWETAHPVEVDTSEMVGKKDKQTVQQPENGEHHPNSGNKFRRTLSHSFAFISNPLSQRAPVSARSATRAPSLAVSESVITDNATLVLTGDASFPPAPKLNSLGCSNGSSTKSTTSAKNWSSTTQSASIPTPKPLVQSRTLSFIPRPVRNELDSVVADAEQVVRSNTQILMTVPRPGSTLSKIPTPSPPLSEHLQSVPRQYLSHHILQSSKDLGDAPHTVRNSGGTQAKIPTRSRTTPNLAKAATLPCPAPSNTMKVTRNTVHEEKFQIWSPQNRLLQENIPTKDRTVHRRATAQERSLRPESLAMPGSMCNRRSFGPGSPLTHSTQWNSNALVAAAKSIDLQCRHSNPLTTTRIQSNPRMSMDLPMPSHIVTSRPIIQPRLLGPKYPPTPVVEFSVPTLSRSTTQKGLRDDLFDVSNNSKFIPQYSHALTVVNHEVSKLPRSCTFHDFGNHTESIPPIPPVPERYRTPSLFDLVRSTRVDPSTVADYDSTLFLSDDALRQSKLGATHEDYSGHSPRTVPQNHPGIISSFEHLHRENDLIALPRRASTLRSATFQNSMSAGGHVTEVPDSLSSRSRSTSKCYFPESADIDRFLQVKDYMPPLYWAGRFQSRLDHWRTEAMAVELNPFYEPTSALGQCNLNQESLAACCIFAQLRELCTSNQAADSLWEFEFRYRKDNKLLGNQFDLPPSSNCKNDDGSKPRRAFGRAVRKLTPRKASLVNLLKGKSWNKNEDMKSSEIPGQAGDSCSGSPSHPFLV